MSFQQAQNYLHSFSSKARKESNMRFFKTGKGQYGEGDLFLGISVPDTRKVVKKYFEMVTEDVLKFVKSPYHEERLLGLLILVEKHKRSSDVTQKKIFKTYIKHFPYVNNWDLVDTTAPYIIGPHLLPKNNKVLSAWSNSPNLWVRRISIISTYYLIKNSQLEETFRIATRLISDEHDLIHKAVGWMLREAGKKNQKTLEDFLLNYASKMPRTMLRYSIEKFPETKRKKYLDLKPT
ncbi:MAG: DNA alkylation repair protein [Bdellovibrionales bacterium]|nr:DNA alkylation repair protein [Bdellovibrionales bacterium]